MTQEEMLSQMEMMLQPLQQVNASQAETIKKLTEQNESLQSRIKLHGLTVSSLVASPRNSPSSIPTIRIFSQACCLRMRSR